MSFTIVREAFMGVFWADFMPKLLFNFYSVLLRKLLTSSWLGEVCLHVRVCVCLSLSHSLHSHVNAFMQTREFFFWYSFKCNMRFGWEVCLTEVACLCECVCVCVCVCERESQCLKKWSLIAVAWVMFHHTLFSPHKFLLHQKSFSWLTVGKKYFKGQSRAKSSHEAGMTCTPTNVAHFGGYPRLRGSLV